MTGPRESPAITGCARTHSVARAKRRGGTQVWLRGWLTALAGCLAIATSVVPAMADEGLVTQAADSLRSAWYGDQAQLDPQTVAGDRFGRTFYRSIEGQGYAQPLVVGGIVLVATNDDQVYGLDARNGAVIWQRSVGPPIESATQIAGECPNPSPHIGILGTPVVDAADGVAYFVAKTYVTGDTGPSKFMMHAVSVATGAERPGFPVTIAGHADNFPELNFNADYELQRPGLALVDGVVYAAFGGICDIVPFQGWIFGVTADGQIVHAWASSPDGASIWQSGGGIVSDGPGQLIVTTGNGSAVEGTSTPAPGPGSRPPAGLAESVVRVAVEAGGALRATDFFSPWDNLALDQSDYDLGSSSPMALPSPGFGTAATPHLLVQDGKSGYVYLLDRDNLGGMGQGPGGGDGVLQRLGPYGGVWDAMASWPGDGGWVYITTVGYEGAGSGRLMAFSYGLDPTGAPRLALAGESADPFAYGSGSPVVTSDGMRSGSAVVWGTWCPAPGCAGAELRAYGAVPAGGTLPLLWRSPVGVANRFTPPGVANGRIYLATADGHLIGYGPAAPISAEDLSFGDTVIGSRQTQTMTIGASEDVTITGISTDDAQFRVDLSNTPLPLVLRAGERVTLPVSYEPTIRGALSRELRIDTTAGERAVVVSGRGLLADLAPSSAQLDFGSVATGAPSTEVLALENTGDVPLTIVSSTLSGEGFASDNLPGVGTRLRSRSRVVTAIRFSASAPGRYAGSLVVRTDHTTTTVGLTASIPAPAAVIEDAAFPDTLLGTTTTRTVRVVADEPLVVDSLSTSASAFSLEVPPVPLPAMLAAGESLNVPVDFAPRTRGAVSAELRVSTSAGDLHGVLSGRGVVAGLSPSAASVRLTAAPGGSAQAHVTFVATGDVPSTILSTAAPSAPFSVRGLPAVGTRLAPGGQFDVEVGFAPLRPGPAPGTLTLVSETGPVVVRLLGTATVPLRARLLGLSVVPARVRKGAHRSVRLLLRLSGGGGALMLVVLRERFRARCGPTGGRCIRWQRVRAVPLRVRAGLDRARLDVSSLPRGTYRLVVTVRGAAGPGSRRSASLRIV